jgi:dUTP pyrophosphatase
MKMKVPFIKLHPDAVMPTYGSRHAAGADLYALAETEILIPAGKTVFVSTGIAMEIPEGFVGLVFARSSMGAKRNLAPANKVGVIDSDYRGEIKVVLHNHGDTDQVVMPGERIAQLAIVPYLTAEFEECTSLSDTERGEGGFGSTGTK